MAYVDVDAFIKRFDGCNVSWVNTMLEELKKFPSADVVKPVRCAVCIHWGRNECPLVKDGEVIKNLGSGFYCRNGDRGE